MQTLEDTLRSGGYAGKSEQVIQVKLDRNNPMTPPRAEFQILGRLTLQQ